MKKIKIQDKELFISNFQLKDINSNYIKWLNNKELLKFSSNKFVNFDKKKCIKFFKSFQNSQNLFLSINSNSFSKISLNVIVSGPTHSII